MKQPSSAVISGKPHGKPKGNLRRDLTGNPAKSSPKRRSRKIDTAFLTVMPLYLYLIFV